MIASAQTSSITFKRGCRIARALSISTSAVASTTPFVRLHGRLHQLLDGKAVMTAGERLKAKDCLKFHQVLSPGLSAFSILRPALHWNLQLSGDQMKHSTDGFQHPHILSVLYRPFPDRTPLYAYVGNNPLSRIDADGHYELNASNCGDNAKCQKEYGNAVKTFETQRQKDLSSKNADVRAAAANYGAKGEANGVHLGFADTAKNGILGQVDPFGSTPGNPNIQVTLDFGRAGSAETQTHEGTHVGDDQKFLDSFNPATGGYDQSLNPTHGQTEVNAFRAGAAVDRSHGFGPNDAQQIMDFLHNSPVYGPIFNNPVFNPANFPAGVPDDEQ